VIDRSRGQQNPMDDNALFLGGGAAGFFIGRPPTEVSAHITVFTERVVGAILNESLDAQSAFRRAR
jgi:hypothetical protein